MTRERVLNCVRFGSAIAFACVWYWHFTNISLLFR